MSNTKFVNIARLMTSYNFEIEQLPDNLKCAQCKLVLKDASQMPCGCRFCRACIDHMMACGIEFCPGESEDCGESTLSRFVTDYVGNKSIYRLIAKCPLNGCVHECQLANMEEHLRECPRNSEECPFRELGCTQDKLAAEEMGGHLQQDTRKHSEILIGLVANINREIETLKHQLEQKDGQIRSIMDQMIHMQNENKSIKEENEDLAGRVRLLSKQMEQEIAERRENDELDSARVIDHVDREIAAVTNLIGSNTVDVATQLHSVRGDIGSIYQVTQLIKDDIYSVIWQVQSTQALVGLGRFDANLMWLIDIDVGNTRLCWPNTQSESEYFYGAVHPYKYQLGSENWDIGRGIARFCIQLRICAGPNDGQLVWPFEARVVITVSDRNRLEVYKRISWQCQIERPPDNDLMRSDTFTFLHSDLITAGLDLSRGVRVLCVISPDAD